MISEDAEKGDLISRQDAIKAMTNAIWHYPNELYGNLNSYDIAEALAKHGLSSLPSAVCDDCIWHVCNYNKVDWDRKGDLISRQDVIKAIQKAETKECAIWSVKDIPSAEKTGKWIFEPKDAIELMFTRPKCSLCGYESADGLNYCPNCGARMVGDTDGKDKSNEPDK